MKHWQRYYSLELAILVLLAPLCRAEATATDKPLFSFVQMTDTHCLTTTISSGRPPENPFSKIAHLKANHWKDLANSFPILEQTVKYINNEIKPDFLIHTGDITENGDLDDLRRSRTILGKLKCPYYACQGDHDVRKTGGVYNYVKVFKKRCLSFDVNEWHFVMMGIYPDEMELKWLEKDLSRNRKKHVVFFTHRLVEADLLTMTAFASAGIPCLMPEAERVRKILGAHGNVVMVLSGHVHMNLNMISVRKGMRDTCFFSTDALAERPHQIKLFKVYGDHVEVVLFTGLTVANIKQGQWSFRTVSASDFLKHALVK